MGNTDGHRDISQAGDRDRSLCSVSCMARIVLWIELWCVSDVIMTLRFRVMEKHG